MSKPKRDPDTVRLCNCAGNSCGVELLGESETTWQAEMSIKERCKWPPLVAGRVDSRPYCTSCWLEIIALRRMHLREQWEARAA